MKISNLSFKAELSVFGYEGKAEYGYLAYGEAMPEGTKPESLLTLKFYGVDQERVVALLARLEQVTSSDPVAASASISKEETGTPPNIPWTERSRIVSVVEKCAAEVAEAREQQVQELSNPQVELQLVVEKVGKVQRPRAKKDNGAKELLVADCTFPPQGHPNAPLQALATQSIVQLPVSPPSPILEPALADVVPDIGEDIPFGAPDTSFDPAQLEVEPAPTKLYSVNLLQLQRARNWREIWESLERSDYTGVDDLTAVVMAYKTQVPLFGKVEPASLASHIAEWVRFRAKNPRAESAQVTLPEEERSIASPPSPKGEEPAFVPKEHVIPPIDPNAPDIAALAETETFTHLVKVLHQHGMYTVAVIKEWCLANRDSILVLKKIPQEATWDDKIDWSIKNLNFLSCHDWTPEAAP